MQKNIKEILKPLVRKILKENEDLPNEKSSPGHKEEAPKSKTASMGTGNEKVKKVASEVLSKLKQISLKLDNDAQFYGDEGDVYTKILSDVIEGILFKHLGPRAYQVANELLPSPSFNRYIQNIKNNTGADILSLFDPDNLKNKFDDIDESLVNEVMKRLRK